MEKGNIVTCILNHRASLTIGKEYPVTEAYSDMITVKCDDGYETRYNKDRFIHTSEFRNLIINQTLE